MSNEKLNNVNKSTLPNQKRKSKIGSNKRKNQFDSEEKSKIKEKSHVDYKSKHSNGKENKFNWSTKTPEKDFSKTSKKDQANKNASKKQTKKKTLLKHGNNLMTSNKQILETGPTHSDGYLPVNKIKNESEKMKKYPLRRGKNQFKSCRSSSFEEFCDQKMKKNTEMMDFSILNKKSVHNNETNNKSKLKSEKIIQNKGWNYERSAACQQISEAVAKDPQQLNFEVYPVSTHRENHHVRNLASKFEENPFKRRNVRQTSQESNYESAEDSIDNPSSSKECKEGGCCNKSIPRKNYLVSHRIRDAIHDYRNQIKSNSCNCLKFGKRYCKCGNRENPSKESIYPFDSSDYWLLTKQKEVCSPKCCKSVKGWCIPRPKLCYPKINFEQKKMEMIPCGGQNKCFCSSTKMELAPCCNTKKCCCYSDYFPCYQNKCRINCYQRYLTWLCLKSELEAVFAEMDKERGITQSKLIELQHALKEHKKVMKQCSRCRPCYLENSCKARYCRCCEPNCCEENCKKFLRIICPECMYLEHN